jgi:hypothetical protein
MSKTFLESQSFLLHLNINMSSSTASKSKTALDIFKNWFINSPSHGIRRVGRSKTFLERLIWLYFFWVFTVLMGTFIAMVVIKYIDNPTKIHLTMRHHQDPTHFPAVTFCKSIFICLEFRENDFCILGNINPLRDDGFLNDIRKSRLPGGGSSSSVSESEYRKAVAAYIDRILNAQVNGQTNPLVEWGYQLNDLLITCVFNKQLCYRNLTQLFHPNYGNCYTFDNDRHVHLDEEAKHIHHDWSIDDNNGDNGYKLFLELFLHQNEYNAYLDSRAAFRIFIHRKHEVPILSQNSVFLGPNKYTKLIFSQRIMAFSRQCRNELTDDMKQIFTNKVRYTQALCYKICEQRIIEQQCKCIEPTLAVFYQFFSNKCESNKATTNISLCSINDRCLTTRNYSGKFEIK